MRRLPRKCLRCRTTAKPPKTPGPGPTMSSRGLCCSCYHILHGTDGLADYPPLIRRREDVVADWKRYRARYPEHTKAEIARLMGMRHKTLDQALCRARRAGLEVAR